MWCVVWSLKMGKRGLGTGQDPALFGAEINTERYGLQPTGTMILVSSGKAARMVKEMQYGSIKGVIINGYF